MRLSNLNLSRMKPGRRGLVAAAIIGTLLLAAVLSRLGQSSEPPSKTDTPAMQTDAEQRARARHGWDGRLTNTSVVRGAITYYDINGIEVQRVGMTLYRGYPDRLRLEIERPGGSEVSGFDGRASWRAGVAGLKEADARDIRSWARMWPDRLFVDRNNGAKYREVGRFADERAAVEAVGTQEQTVVAEQVEVEDTVGPLAEGPLDWRRVSYYLDSRTSLVYSARWLEPNDPNLRVDDPAAALVDVRVDFSNWAEVEGVAWPFQVTHYWGGRLDFRIDVSGVEFDQQAPDTIFQDPNR